MLVTFVMTVGFFSTYSGNWDAVSGFLWSSWGFTSVVVGCVAFSCDVGGCRVVVWWWSWLRSLWWSGGGIRLTLVMVALVMIWVTEVVVIVAGMEEEGYLRLEPEIVFTDFELENLLH